MAVAKEFNGIARWTCGDPTCPVACFDHNCYPDPKVERQPGLFEQRRRAR